MNPENGKTSNQSVIVNPNLTEVGDPIAKRVFKEEIIERFFSGNESIKEFLYMEEYFSYLDNEEIINGVLKPQKILNLLVDQHGHL